MLFQCHYVPELWGVSISSDDGLVLMRIDCAYVLFGF